MYVRSSFRRECEWVAQSLQADLEAASRGQDNTANMEEAARVISKAFSSCVTDRYICHCPPSMSVLIATLQAVASGGVAKMGRVLRCWLDIEVLLSGMWLPSFVCMCE